MHQDEEITFKSLFIPLTTKKAIVFIFLTGFIAFSNMLFNGFVEDDRSYIINYLPIHTINIFFSFGQNLFNYLGQYRPIPYLYFSILYSIFTTNPFFYHILQLLLHITCTILIYFLFKKFLSSYISLFLSLVFLIHPINVESVSYISQSFNPIFLLFGILALIISINISSSKKIANNTKVIVFCLTLLSILTKETGIIFIFLIPTYMLLFQKNRIFTFTGLGFISIFTYAFARFFIGNVGFMTRPLTPIADLPLIDRLLNIPSIIWFYFKTFFYPSRLIIDQQWAIGSLNFYTFYLPLLFSIGIVAFLVIFLRYLIKSKKDLAKPFLFFTIWFLLGLFMHLQIFPLDKTVADRWFYFPMVGLLGMIGIFIETYKSIFLKRTLLALGIVIIILILLSIRTIIRNTNWHNSITLYNHDIKINDNFEIENNLGVEYENQGKYALANKYFNRSVDQRPFEQNLFNLGSLYTKTGDLKSARKYYELALRSKDYKLLQGHRHDLNLYKAYFTICILYQKDPLILSVVKDSIIDYPESSDLWTFLAIAYYENKDQQNAASAIYKAYSLSPNPFNGYIMNQIVNNQDLKINFTGFDGKNVNLSIEK